MQTTAWGKNKIINITTLAVSATLPKVRPLLPNSRWNQVHPILSHSLLWKKTETNFQSAIFTSASLGDPPCPVVPDSAGTTASAEEDAALTSPPTGCQKKKPARSLSPGTRASADGPQAWAGAAAPGRLPRCERNPPPPPPRAHS